MRAKEPHSTDSSPRRVKRIRTRSNAATALRYSLLLSVVGVGIGAAGIGIWHGRYVGYAHSVAPPERSVDVDSILNRLPLDALAETAQDRDHERILLITLDTIRTDHLSTYGYPLPTSPFLDALAEQSVVFDRAYTPMSTTVPAHVSIFSALYPIEHGVTRNGLSLVDQISTLPEVLSRLGFTTAAVVSTGLFSGSNMSQGFDVFEEPSRAELQGRRDQVLVAEEEPLPYRPAEQTLAVALDVLAELRDAERSFLWIHLYDPHLPYVQRREEQALLGSSPSVDGESFRRLVEGLHHASLDDEELAWVLAYDAEVLYMDQELGAFFARAGEHEVDDYLTVIVGDHGEGLGSHDWWDHGKHVYEEQRKVPLLVRWPAHRHVGRVDAVVEILDIMPTILWAVGAQPDALADRALPVEGLPLQWLLEGRLGAEAFSAALVQRRTYTRPNPLGILRSRLADRFGMERQFNQFEEGERFVLVRNDSAYVHSTVHEDELFDLRIDPGETDNRCCTGSGLEKQLRAELLSVLADLSRFPAPGERIVDPDTLKQLRALGYIQ